MNKYIYSLLLSLIAICPITAMEPIDGPARAKRQQSELTEQPEAKASRTAHQEYFIPAAVSGPDEIYDDFFDELPPLELIAPAQNIRLLEETEPEAQSISMQDMEEIEQEMQGTSIKVTAQDCNKKHICKCGKTFSRANALKDHIAAIHLKIKPYQCPALGCGHSATQERNLLTHIKRVHADLRDLKPIPLSQERKDENDKLMKKFQNSTLSVSEAEQEAQSTSIKVTALGRNKKLCNCGKLFGKVSDLKNHIAAIHLNIKPYQCPAPGCMQRSAQESNLLTHIKRNHADLKDLKPNTLSQEQKDEINKLIEEYIVHPEKQTSIQKSQFNHMMHEWKL